MRVCSPPQMTPVGGRLSNFVEGWKRITNDPYVLGIIAKGYRLRFTSPPLLFKFPGRSGLTRVLLERIPGSKSFRSVASSYRSKESERPHSCTSFRSVASSYRSKESERPHSCTSFPYVHYKLCSKLCSKRRLRVQNRPAGCVLSSTYLSLPAAESTSGSPSKTRCTSFGCYHSV